MTTTDQQHEGVVLAKQLLGLGRRLRVSLLMRRATHPPPAFGQAGPLIVIWTGRCDNPAGDH